MSGEPNSTDVWPQRAGPPKGGMPLAEVREAHHRALVMVAALEEEIEWLSCPLAQSQSETQAHSHSRDHCRHRSWGWKERHCQVWLEDCHAPYFEYHPSGRSSESGGEAAASKDLDLEDLPELVPEVTYFLQGSAKSSGENMRVPSPKPPIEEL